jgi:hypothetical protein
MNTSGLEFAAGQAGIAQGDFTTGMTRLNQEIGKALAGNKAASTASNSSGFRSPTYNGSAQPRCSNGWPMPSADAGRRPQGGARFGVSSAGRWPAGCHCSTRAAPPSGRVGDEFDRTIGGFSNAQIALATRSTTPSAQWVEH